MKIEHIVMGIARLVLSATVVSVAGWAVAEEQETSQGGNGAALGDAEAQQINEDYALPSAQKQVRAAIEAYYQKKGISEGVTGPKGQVYYSATERVTADPASPHWVQSRTIAFEKAMLKLQQSFVFDSWGNTITKADNSIDSDESSNNREFPKKEVSRGRLAAMWDKLTALGESYLDDWLEGQGVDPAAFDAVSPAQRKDLFIDRYISKTLQQATGSSAGLIAMKTFYGSDNKGNWVVGVVGKYSPALKQLAFDIGRGTVPFLETKKGKYPPTDDFVMSQSPEALSTTFGIRIMFDEQGQAVVLSHGLWGHGYKGTDEKRRFRAEQSAIRQANAAANSQLAKFVNGRLRYSEESEVGQLEENFLVRRGDSITEEDIVTYIDKLSSEISIEARSDMKGVRTVRQWTYNHPNGHVIEGVIRAWRVDFAEQANDVRKFRPERRGREAEDTEASGAVEETEAGVSSNDAYDEMDEDF